MVSTQRAWTGGHVIVPTRKAVVQTRMREYFTLIRDLARFRETRLDREPSDRALADRAGVSPTTVGVWLRGEAFPQSIDKVIALVTAIRAEAQRRQVPAADRDALDERAWRQAHRQEAQNRALAGGRAVRGAQAAGILAAHRTSRHAVSAMDPFRLGVHQIASLPGDNRKPSLTPYILREHDQVLRAALRAAVGSGPSVFALVVGGSTVGKTRAAYEALTALVPSWPILVPSDAGELLQVLDEDQVTTGTVLWLNEAQRHLYGTEGEMAAKRLQRLLFQVPGVVIVGTIWVRPYLADLMASGALPDIHAAARTLVTGPRSIRVVVQENFTSSQIDDLARQGDTLRDARLTDAARARGGRVIQQLTGGPELVAAYEDGMLFSQPERALITAALDARRLGHHRPMAPLLLGQAAEGYLEPWERPADPQWADKVLTELATGIREDGTRTDVRQVLRALAAVRSQSGGQPSYEPADYLEQYARRSRRYHLGVPELWEALIDHASDRDDLYRLAHEAFSRCMYKYAVALRRKAIERHHGKIFRRDDEMLTAACRADPDSSEQIAAWTDRYLDESQPKYYDQTISKLIDQLPSLADDDLISRLAELALDYNDNPYLLGMPSENLLLRLHRDRRAAAARFLAHRIASDGSLAPYYRHDAEYSQIQHVDRFLKLIREVGGEEALSAVTSRLASEASAERAWGANFLLKALWDSGSRRQALEFAGHVAVQVDTDDYTILETLALFRLMKAENAWSALAYRVASDVRLGSYNMDDYVKELTSSSDRKSADTLLLRLTEYVRQRPSGRIYSILTAYDARTGEEARAIAADSAAQVPIDDPVSVAGLLHAFREGGMDEAMQSLLDRDVGRRMTLGADALVTAALLKQLRLAGANTAIDRLLERGLIDQIDINAGSRYGIGALFGELDAAGAAVLPAVLAERIARDLDARSVSHLATALVNICRLGLGQSFRKLIDRIPPDVEFQSSDIIVAQDIVKLLELLIAGNASGMAAALAGSMAQIITLAHPEAIARLVTRLAEAGQRRAAIMLAERVSQQIDLDDPEIDGDTSPLYDWWEATDSLVDKFKQIGAREAALTVLRRLVDRGERPFEWKAYAAAAATSAAEEQLLLRFGRDASGAPQAWTWADTAPA